MWQTAGTLRTQNLNVKNHPSWEPFFNLPQRLVLSISVFTIQFTFQKGSILVTKGPDLIFDLGFLFLNRWRNVLKKTKLLTKNLFEKQNRDLFLTNNTFHCNVSSQTKVSFVFTYSVASLRDYHLMTTFN